LFNAHTILAAAIDNSPGPVEIAEQTLLGRITGGEIAALTPTQVRTLLSILAFPNTIANVLSDHDKAAHDALAIDAGSVDGKEPGSDAGDLLVLDSDKRVPAIQASLYLTADELYTKDYGLKWTDLGVISATEAHKLLALGNGIAILADHSGAGSRLYRSTDYGATWADLGAIMTMAATGGVYLGNGIALLGDEAGRIFRSTDYGVIWTDLGDKGTGGYCFINLGFGIAIFANNDKHIFRSLDWGASWTDLGSITAGNPYAGAYLGNGIAIIGDSAKHIFRTTDYGLSWSDLGIITESTIEAAEYLGNGIAIICTSSNHVWRSSNYGASWTDYGGILNSYGASITNIGWGSCIVCDGGGHVFRTSDFGLTWTDLGAIASSSIFTSCFLGHGVCLIGDNNGHILRSTSAFGLGDFNPYEREFPLQFGCLGAITPNGTSYLASGNGATQTNEIRIRVPRTGILRNLYVWQRVASGAAGRTDIYTVRVNGADKAITCTLNNATTGEDTTHAVPVAAGNAVSIKLVSNNASDTSADVTASLTLT